MSEEELVADLSLNFGQKRKINTYLNTKPSATPATPASITLPIPHVSKPSATPANITPITPHTSIVADNSCNLMTGVRHEARKNQTDISYLNNLR